MKHIIAIDLGGTAIKFGLLTEDGRLLHRGNLPTQATSARSVLENLGHAAYRCLQYASEQHITPSAIGIGTPGIVDAAYRKVLGGADNIPGWSHIDLAGYFEAKYSLPTFVNNDANMMGLGEQWQGAARGSSDVVFLTVGTGIGGAVIIDGKPYGGYANRGTELGHIPLLLDGKPCSCGSTGCLEAYAATSALVEDYKQLVGTTHAEVSGITVVNGYLKGEKQAIEALNNHFRYLGRGIAALVNIFSPQQVVVGGGISEAGAFYIENIIGQYEKHVMPDCAANTTVCAALLGNNAALYGAARWAFMQLPSALVRS